MIISACRPNKDSMVMRFSEANQQFFCYFLCSSSSSRPLVKKKNHNDVDKHSQRDEYTKLRVYYNVKTPMRSQQTEQEWLLLSQIPTDYERKTWKNNQVSILSCPYVALYNFVFVKKIDTCYNQWAQVFHFNQSGTFCEGFPRLLPSCKPVAKLLFSFPVEKKAKW